MPEKVIDLDEVLERVQDDKELLMELFDLFINDFQKKREFMATALTKNDYDQMRDIAHSLKGAAANLSAKSLRESMTQLEQTAQNHDFTNGSSLLKEIDARYKILLDQITILKKEFQ